MCRLAAYSGPELLLEKLFHENPHSLYTQSWASEEMKETSLNADGFGFGWHLDSGEAMNFTSTLPIWADTNLAHLSRSMSSELWLAYVRSATPGQSVNQANTQPFISENLLFLHNGRVENFNQGPRQAMHDFLHADIACQIEGNSDSEYFFALLKQLLAQHNDIEKALGEVCHSLVSLLGNEAALVNMIVSDGDSIYACRHGLNGGHCPSLYISEGHAHFPDAVVLASERFSENDAWQEVAEHSLLCIDSDQKVIKNAL